MWGRRDLERTDDSQEFITSIIRVERVSEPGKTLAITSKPKDAAKKYFAACFSVLVIANVVPSMLILSTLMMVAILSSESSVLRRTTRHHIPVGGILHETLHYEFISYIRNIYMYLECILLPN
jgi:hypothetical protein